MTYPLFAGEPTEVEEPPVIGADIEFLLDTPAGHVVAGIKEIADMVEADLYADEPTTLDESRLFLLGRNHYPRMVSIRYKLIQSNCVSPDEGPRYHLKTVQIVDIDGGIVAEAPYRVYEQAATA